MPITFAHPAIVLPFSRSSRYINFSALVLGSMAPDFEYFLRGRPLGEIGHTPLGFVAFNLPLVALIYCIYHCIVRGPLVEHLPVFLQDSYIHRSNSSIALKITAFCYCALFGMCTHVAWDAFTHPNGAMVLRFPAFFAKTFSIYGFDIPLYKFLQHGSTLAGLSSIFLYVFFRAMAYPQEVSKVHFKRKLSFWSSVLALSLLLMCSWSLIDYISLSSYGITVVRLIDSALISLVAVCLISSIGRKNKTNT